MCVNKLMLENNLLDHKEQTSSKFQLKCIHLHSGKCIWKRRLVSYFFLGLNVLIQISNTVSQKLSFFHSMVKRLCRTVCSRNVLNHICKWMSMMITHELIWQNMAMPNVTWHNCILTHWGRVTHICVGKLTIIGSDIGLSPGRRQANTFSFKKKHLMMSSAKWCLFHLGLNVLNSGYHGWRNIFHDKNFRAND